MNRFSKYIFYPAAIGALLFIQHVPRAKAEPASSGGVPWEDYWRLESRVKGLAPGTIESINLHGKRQLFIDNYVIEYMNNLTKVLHQPRKYGANPVLKSGDKPWDIYVGWASIIQDQEDNCFKAWYLSESGLAYATSQDGIRWDKPSLGIFDWKGSKANNLVMGPEVVSPSVIKDPFDSDPRRRYKIFAFGKHPDYGIYVYFSPDGIHWKGQKEPVLTSANDAGLNDRPTMFLDTARKRYIALTKREMNNPYGSGDWGMIQRCRAVSVSSDFEHWSNPVLTLHPDDMDPPDLQIYGVAGFNYEGMYIGLMDTYWSRPSGPLERTVDTELVSSRDGETWWRAGNRRTFLPRGREEEWDRAGVYPENCPPLRMGDQLWFYYCGDSHRHRDNETPAQRRGSPWFAPGHPTDPPLKAGVPDSGVGLAMLRVDGFISLDAGNTPGTLMTKPLVFSGRELHINANASKGSIRADILEATSVPNDEAAFAWKIGQPLPGFAAGDSIPVTIDSTDGVVHWKNSATLDRLAGKYIVIRFYLQQASLYSFWIQ